VSVDQAIDTLDDIEARLDVTTEQMVEVIRGSFHKDLPIMLRVLAISVVSGAYAEALVKHQRHDAEPVNRAEYLPDIILALRASADLFEEANRLGKH
jgi:hypothetical protein